jgi:predicted transglutaminase-like cysteine proteinase
MARCEWKSMLVAMAIAASAWGQTAEAAEAFMRTGGRTSQPVGHYEFCLREPDECRQKTPRRAPVELTRKVWETIVGVNDRVNLAVVPLTDMEIWGQEEIWSYPTRVGDCEDFAIEKRRQLMKAGIPAGDLLLTVARQPNGDGHAVLTVRTSRGDFILDNLEPRVLAWSESEYTYLKRQSERNSGTWVAVTDSRATAAVGSVR